MSIARQKLPADRNFWSGAAGATLALAEQLELAPPQLSALTLLVPQGHHAALARAALRAALGERAASGFFPPRLLTFAAYCGERASDLTLRADLFAALRASDWMRAAFGNQPAALWKLAHETALVCDELTLAAIDGESAFASRLDAALARHFKRRAARAMEPQAQLLLQLWRATRRGDSNATRMLRTLTHKAAHAGGPLIFVADVPPAPWVRAFLVAYAKRAPVLLLEADVADVVREQPLLAAAWPELTDAGDRRDVPLAFRAARVPQQASAGLTVFAADSLEDEAHAVAAQVLAWLQAGRTSIALVALDRVAARRVRALLERAGVLVQDETGWRLATTTAAGSVMRWFDLVAGDFYWRDFLDWLKSPFTGFADKARVVAALEAAIRAGGALQGMRAMRHAWLDHADRRELAGERRVVPQRLLQQLDEQRRVARNARTFSEHALALSQALNVLGCRAALALDAVGQAVLRELDTLLRALQSNDTRADFEEFRALVAAHFEQTSWIDRSVASPVMMVSLAATQLREFDAAVLIGADDEHLPGVADDLLFLSSAVRADLGLPGAAAARVEQASSLALLLANVPDVIATWRHRREGEPSALSPLLERLQLATRVATGGELVRPASRAGEVVSANRLVRPAPAAGALLPLKLSASHYQSLINCGYQFFARHLLGLRELEDLIEEPAKRDFGQAVHQVLLHFHRHWGEQDFSVVPPLEVRASLIEHGNAVFDPLLIRLPSFLAFKVRFEMLVGDYCDWLNARALEGWRFSSGEERCSRPLSLGDRDVELNGRIDRIDVHRDGALQLIDYKARPAHVLAAGLREAGEDVQLPFYGLLLGEAPIAGAMYLSVDRQKPKTVQEIAPPQDFSDLVVAVRAKLLSDLQRIVEGAPLPALGTEATCKFCEMRGLCRRDFWSGAES